MATAKKSTAAGGARARQAEPAPDPNATEFPDERSIRIRAYNPRAGYVVQRYTYRGIKFLESGGWYTVPLTVATYLATVRNIFDDPHSPKIFQVETIEEAKRIAAREYEEKLTGGRLKPGDSPVLQPRDTSDQIREGADARPVRDTDLTTADLRRREETDPGVDPRGERRMRPA